MEANKIVEINELANFIQTGYRKIYCNPKNKKRLSMEFPQLTFTVTNSVEENQVIFANIPTFNELCPHGYDWDDCPDCRH